jgi:hypothetical protein
MDTSRESALLVNLQPITLRDKFYPSCVANTGLNSMENTYKLKPR